MTLEKKKHSLKNISKELTNWKDSVPGAGRVRIANSAK